jgi:hypothetical protein
MKLTKEKKKMKTHFDKEIKAKKVQKIKKDLPHSVASVPLTS